MENNTYAPILLFVYNRPAHTRRLVESLLKTPKPHKATCLSIRMPPVMPRPPRLSPRCAVMYTASADSVRSP